MSPWVFIQHPWERYKKDHGPTQHPWERYKKDHGPTQHPWERNKKDHGPEMVDHGTH
jgi:hypothetical protein